MEISQESEPIIEEISTQENELQEGTRVKRFVEIINTEVSRIAIIANVNYQFRPDQSWKIRVQTIFNDLFENHDN